MNKFSKLILICLLLGLLACSQKKITLSNNEDMQYLITSPNGHRILIDTSNLQSIPKKIGKEDVLVSTHKKFWEPFVSGAQCFLTTNADFAKDFPGQKLDAVSGTITLDDATIVSLPSARRQENAIDNANADNFIIVVTTGGLKFVFLGFLGQETLNDTQLAAVKNADFLFLTTFNQWGDQWPVSTLYPNWIAQINPRFIVPTVYAVNELKKLCTEFSVYYPGKDMKTLKLSSKALSECDTPAVLTLRSQMTALVKSFNPKKSDIIPRN